MIESRVYEQLLRAHALDHIGFAKHAPKAHIILVAYYPMLQIEVSYIQQPYNIKNIN